MLVKKQIRDIPANCNSPADIPDPLDIALARLNWPDIQLHPHFRPIGPLVRQAVRRLADQLKRQAIER